MLFLSLFPSGCDVTFNPLELKLSPLYRDYGDSSWQLSAWQGVDPVNPF